MLRMWKEGTDLLKTVLETVRDYFLLFIFRLGACSIMAFSLIKLGYQQRTKKKIFNDTFMFMCSVVEP